MSYYSNQPTYPPSTSPNAAQNLQFYSSSYGANVSGHTTPSQASYGGYSSQPPQSSYPSYGGGQPAFGTDVSGRMGENAGLRTGWIAAFSTEGYENEPGLMVELGVNFQHIKTKTMTVLNPLSRPSPHIMDDSDLWGALLYVCAYGAFLALSGKFAWGYIYGIALFGSFALHWIFALMTPDISDPNNPSHLSGINGVAGHGHMHNASTDSTHGHGMGGGHFSSTLTYSRSASVLGYCFLPLALIALFGVVVPMDSALGYGLTASAVAWCTYASSGMFVSVGRMQGMRGLVAYPCALFYVGFGIMGIFSSRSIAVVAGVGGKV